MSCTVYPNTTSSYESWPTPHLCRAPRTTIRSQQETNMPVGHPLPSIPPPTALAAPVLQNPRTSGERNKKHEKRANRISNGRNEAVRKKPRKNHHQGAGAGADYQTHTSRNARRRRSRCPGRRFLSARPGRPSSNGAAAAAAEEAEEAVEVCFGVGGGATEEGGGGGDGDDDDRDAEPELEPAAFSAAEAEAAP